MRCRSMPASSGANTVSRSSSVYPQIDENTGSSVMSVRLFRSENRLTLVNLLTPVTKVKWTCASLDLIIP